MGFRYVSVRGISADRIKVTARALYSDVKDNGSFTCSNEMINRLQENIRWGAKSNFVDIPTDCPQRDERMGWTGDIALFANTAVYNYDCGRFLKKWLKDMRAEQKATGGIPNTIPSQGYGFPVTMPVMAVDFWGDASVLVPYAQYMADGDEKILIDNYEMMKKYVNACRFWAGFLSFGKRRHLWNTMSVLHFGDWVAPDVPKMSQWQKRSKWTATASLSNTSRLLSEIAGILGKSEDEALYKKVSENAADAYRKYLTDGNGRLKEEFQTAYVLPIYFGMFKGKEKANAADNLAELVRKNDYKIGTGFPGTPYILFALADNGHEDEAFKMLTNTQCPSWLYEVKMGATTIWERWDGLDENGNCPIGDDGTDVMISYNHYASGAVGDFLYRRVAGIEPLEAGYKRFAVKPLVGGGLTSACGRLNTPYGEIVSSWEILEDDFRLEVKVPVGSSCKVTLPDGAESELASGQYVLTCKV
jgi:alpha-L-rhamnosidase